MLNNGKFKIVINMSNFFQKLHLLLLSTKVIKNWHVYPLSYFGFIRGSVIFHLKNGLNLVVRSPKKSTDIHIFTEIWLENEYDDEFLKIQDNDVIIDIGAHAGYFSLKASSYCKNGKIFSFEPFPDNFKILKENIQINNIQNITANNIAISNRNGKQKLYLGHDSTNSLVKKKSNSIEVSTIKLENVFEQYDILSCDLLKIDCEGAEYEIILDLNPEILKKIKKISMEYHIIPELDYTGEKLVSFLKSNNFKVTSKKLSQTTGLLFATNLLQ